MMKDTLEEGLPQLGLELPPERVEALCAFGRAVVQQNEVMNLTAITNSMMKDTLEEGLPQLGLELPPERVEALCAFGRAVVQQNEVMNLTAITEDRQVAKLHLLDSLTVLACADLKGKRLIDVGCGAGFPGVPLAIACPDGVPLAIACPEADVTLLDSLGKRMKWLESVLPQLSVQAQCITARAEEAVAQRREQYDYATSRAVARQRAAPAFRPGPVHHGPGGGGSGPAPGAV